MRAVLVTVAFGWALCHAPPVQAAPFCVEVQGVAEECWYHDIGLCRQDAAQKEGECTANREEVDIHENAEAFCAIDSSLVPVCAFPSEESCSQSVVGTNRICFESEKTRNGVPSRLDKEVLADLESGTDMEIVRSRKKEMKNDNTF